MSHLSGCRRATPRFFILAISVLLASCGEGAGLPDDGAAFGSTGIDPGSSGAGSDESGDAGTGSSGGPDDDTDGGYGETNTGTTGGAAEDSSGDTTGAGMPEIPDNAFCADVMSWEPGWVAWEEDVLDLVNDERAQGGSCGNHGSFPPSGPLTMEGHLRCAARAHSLDMVERDFFDHYNPDGDGPAERAGYAGYVFSTLGENIAAGQPSPAEVVQGWLGSPGHCKNIRNPEYTEIGVGYYAGGSYGHVWTQVFGRP